MAGIIIPKPAPMPMPIVEAAPLSPPCCRHLGHALRGLKLHERVQIADRAHRAAGIDRLLHFIRRRDGVDEEIDQLQAILAKSAATFARAAEAICS